MRRLEPKLSSMLYGLLIAVIYTHSPQATAADAAPGSWGINVQTIYHAPALQALGTQWVRLTMRWENIERDRKGAYDWTGPDRILPYYLNAGFNIIVVLTAEKFNPLYRDNIDNKTFVADAVARWMGAAAQRFKGKRIIWEIGNEPQVFPMEGYWTDPKLYTAMARNAARLIKQADSGARTAALALAWMDRTYATAALDAGLLSDGTIDYLSFHGYHRKSIEPESGLAEDVQWLRSKATSAAKPGTAVPQVIDTETGYSLVAYDTPKTRTGWRLAVNSEDAQAAFLARHFLEEMALQIPISIWYKDMNDPKGFSLYYGDETDPRGLRPMGRTFSTLAKLLPENPAALQNTHYAVSIEPKQAQDGATLAVKIAAAAKPGGTSTDSGPHLEVRSFVRNTADNQRELIIAAWNAVEAFDGKILASRTFDNTQVLERWRAASSNDPVSVASRVVVEGLTPALAHSLRVLSLPDGSPQDTAKVVDTSVTNRLALNVSVSPMPTIIMLRMSTNPRPPENISITK